MIGQPYNSVNQPLRLPSKSSSFSLQYLEKLVWLSHQLFSHLTSQVDEMAWPYP